MTRPAGSQATEGWSISVLRPASHIFFVLKIFHAAVQATTNAFRRELWQEIVSFKGFVVRTFLIRLLMRIFRCSSYIKMPIVVGPWILWSYWSPKLVGHFTTDAALVLNVENDEKSCLSLFDFTFNFV